jgi:hypothetical protein
MVHNMLGRAQAYEVFHDEESHYSLLDYNAVYYGYWRLEEICCPILQGILKMKAIGSIRNVSNHLRDYTAP